MKKTILMSLAAAAALNAADVNSEPNAGHVSGQIRAAYVANDYDAGGNDYAAALGGVLKYETRTWNGFKLGAAAYASQKADFATGKDSKANGDFLDENKKSYAYVGEAYIDYSASDLTLRVGRQLLDTPLADTDDIRMHPNTFEAAIATYGGIENTTLIGGYVTRWAGFDSGDDKSTFKKPGGAESDGIAVAGILNTSVDNLSLQGWYYGIDRVADAFYADATYTLAFNDTASAELAAQYAMFNEDKASSVDGSVYGLGIRINAGAFTMGTAYNRAFNHEGKTVVNGYGGGPYLTSMEEWTIDGMEDAKAYQISGEVDMGFAGIEGLSISTLYGIFKSAALETRIKEWDLILAYELSEMITVDASYAVINDCYDNADGGSDAGYRRALVRANFNF
jgi:hypothetical protein